jgi:hypothetical protein
MKPQQSSENILYRAICPGEALMPQKIVNDCSFNRERRRQQIVDSQPNQRA